MYVVEVPAVQPAANLDVFRKCKCSFVHEGPLTWLLIVQEVIIKPRCPSGSCRDFRPYSLRGCGGVKYSYIRVKKYIYISDIAAPSIHDYESSM